MEEAFRLYEQVKVQIKKTRTLNPENYPALDVLAWVTIALVDSNQLSDTQLREIEAEVFHLFEMGEVEGIGDAHWEDFLTKKRELALAFGKKEISEQAFAQLDQIGSAAGYYLTARRKIYQVDYQKELTKDEQVLYSITFDYLDQHYDKIYKDPRCLYLLLKLWWGKKTGKPLFYLDKQTLPFSFSDWEYCLKILEQLISVSALYAIPSLLYLKGLANFHLERYTESMSIFKELSTDTEFSFKGRRRVTKSYLASDSQGNPIIYTGQVRNTVNSQN